MKKNQKILLVLGIIFVIVILYFVSHKKDSFYNMVLNDYKKSELTEFSISYPFINEKSSTKHHSINSKDKDSINKLINYFKELKIKEYKESSPYNMGNPYIITLYFRTEKDDNIFNDTVTIQLHDKDLEFIEADNKYGFKHYKIIDGKFNIEFVKKLIENKE